MGQQRKGPSVHAKEVRPPWFVSISTYFAYGLLTVLGWLRDFVGAIFKPQYRPPEGYAPLLVDFEDFYTRRMYRRIQDAWNRPICSAPGTWIEVMLRESKDGGKTINLTGETRKCLNVGSYNYLGFGDPNSPTRDAVLEALKQYSVATTSTRSTLGSTQLHEDLEDRVAKFVRKPAAMVFGMGFGTNGTGIPSLVGKGGLIISDSMNHSSIVFGARSAGATVVVFKHNDPEDLERVVRRAIIDGQPRTHRPWKKILIIVEGIYSMEGEICPLPEIIKIKKKYNCYLYVDEAHSIGALGESGRGVVEHHGCNPDDVDIMMGTFTKSFGAVGGYIAANKDVIEYLRHNCAGSLYSQSISPPACQQIISALQIMTGEDGTDLGKRKLIQLRENSNMVRRRLQSMGCHVLGDWDSPIIPLMLYQPSKISAFSRECLKHGLAVVVVGFPATALLLARTRICISAGHTKQDLEFALEQIEKCVSTLNLRYAKSFYG